MINTSMIPPPLTADDIFRAALAPPPAAASGGAGSGPPELPAEAVPNPITAIMAKYKGLLQCLPCRDGIRADEIASNLGEKVGSRYLKPCPECGEAVREVVDNPVLTQCLDELRKALISKVSGALPATTIKRVVKIPEFPGLGRTFEFGYDRVSEKDREISLYTHLPDSIICRIRFFIKSPPFPSTYIIVHVGDSPYEKFKQNLVALAQFCTAAEIAFEKDHATIVLVDFPGAKKFFAAFITKNELPDEIYTSIKTAFESFKET